MIEASTSDENTSASRLYWASIRFGELVSPQNSVSLVIQLMIIITYTCHCRQKWRLNLWRSFFCLWLHVAVWWMNWRPDLTGMVLQKCAIWLIYQNHLMLQEQGLFSWSYPLWLMECPLYILLLGDLACLWRLCTTEMPCAFYHALLFVLIFFI